MVEQDGIDLIDAREDENDKNALRLALALLGTPKRSDLSDEKRKIKQAGSSVARVGRDDIEDTDVGPAYGNHTKPNRG